MVTELQASTQNSRNMITTYRENTRKYEHSESSLESQNFWIILNLQLYNFFIHLFLFLDRPTDLPHCNPLNLDKYFNMISSY
jgi:hypothetical protein